MVCYEVDDTPLDVIPLASSFPLLEERGDGNQLILDVEPPLSDWVLGKYKAFGEYVGTSYEGYEPEILALLKSIDSRRPKQGREEGVQKQNKAEKRVFRSRLENLGDEEVEYLRTW